MKAIHQVQGYRIMKDWQVIQKRKEKHRIKAFKKVQNEFKQIILK